MSKQHSHHVEFVQWPGRGVHIHHFSANTTVNDGHRHLMRGTTSKSAGEIDDHVHYYEGRTSFNDGHDHFFRGWTGTAIPLPGGGHIHAFSGQTTFDDGHTHYYRGFTGRNIP